MKTKIYKNKLRVVNIIIIIMGCQGAKNLQISNNLAFQNGKITTKDGNYYLERSRYHDKLNPNV